MKLHKTLLVVSCLLATLSGFAQPGSWERLFNVEGNSTNFECIIETSDHGFLVVGYRLVEAGNTDILAIRLDSLGNTEWEALYGNDLLERGRCVTELANGSFILSGDADAGAATTGSGFLMQINAQGDSVWRHNFGNMGSGTALSKHVTDANGNIYAVGYKHFGTAANQGQHPYLLSTDAAGGLIWEDTITATGNGLLEYIGWHGPDTLIIAGRLENWRTYLSTVDPTNGSLFWEQSYPPSLTAYSVIPKPAGGFYVGCALEATAVVLDVDAAGNLLWDSSYSSTPLNNLSYGQLVAPQDGSLGFVLLSNSHPTIGQYDQTGTNVWETVSPVPLGPWQEAKSIAPCSDGGYVCVRHAPIFTTTGGLTGHVMKVGPAGELDCNALLAVEEPAICMVGLDSASNQHEVVWEKGSITVPHSTFNIHRESSVSNEWDLIGTVDSSDFSTYVDAGSDASVTSSRYYISLEDDYCQLESQPSPVHQTMHLTVNAGANDTWNLLWNEYEGFAVTTYNVWRSNGVDPAQLVGSVNGSTFSWSDLTPPTGALYYQVEVVKADACTPTAKAWGYGSVRSNVAFNNYVGIPAAAQTPDVSIFPNPATSTTRIQLTTSGDALQQLELFTIAGARLRTWSQINAPFFNVSLDGLAAGTYVLAVTTASGATQYKRITKAD